MQRVDIAIVGGGASGAILATRLLEFMPGGSIGIIERSGQLGRGVAYGPQDRTHRLNVRAANMSIKPEEPGHFVSWLESQGYSGESIGIEFVPRHLFGEYISHGLLAAQHSSKASLTIISDEAQSLGRDDTLRIGLKSGPLLEAKAVVLAMGNLGPRLPVQLAHLATCERVIVEPWHEGALGEIRPSDRVLFVGTSLTMVDSVLSLVASGHTGKLFARSRHGLMPQSHAKADPVQIDIPCGEGLQDRIIEAVRAGGDNWRAVVDALRPRTVEMWQSLSWKERNQFRRRLQVFWDVHRHRIPNELHVRLSDLIDSGQLDLQKGPIIGAETSGNFLNVHFSCGIPTIQVDWIVNCTGPSADLKVAQLPIIESAVAAELVSYDPLGLGLMADNDGRTNDAGDVFTLGPLCRGCRLETTAIPEIRSQATHLAQLLTNRIADYR